MSTAVGVLHCRDGGHMMAMFVVDDIQYAFSANISPPPPPFTANSATVTFNDVDSLTASHPFSGHIGTDTIELDLNNGVKIKAQLSVSGVSSASTFQGQGAWEQI